MISLSWENNIASISLDRAETRNALGISDWRDLAALVATIRPEDCAAVILRSSDPKAFCSGSDIKQLVLLADEPDARSDFRLAMASAIEGMAALPIPTLAVIEGACFGAGVALALACDIRLSGPTARYCVPPAKLGITYPQSDIARLVDTVGPGQAARLLYTAQPVPAQVALEMGLIEIVAEDPLKEAIGMANVMASLDQHSIMALKTGIGNTHSTNSIDFDAIFDNMFASEGFSARTRHLRESLRTDPK